MSIVDSAIAPPPLPDNHGVAGLQAAAFDSVYRLEFAHSEAQRAAAFAVRYQVYCEEFTCYEPKARFPDHLERNASDSHSLHMLVTRRSDGTPVATSRLVLTNPADPLEPLPFEEACADTLHPWAVPEDMASRRCIAELSRYAIVGAFRRHHVDSLSETENLAQPVLPIVMALFSEAVARQAGIQSIYAVMEDWLADGARAIGMRLIPIGAPTAFHGMRTPYSVDFSSCSQMFPELHRTACTAALQAAPYLPISISIPSLPPTRNAP